MRAWRVRPWVGKAWPERGMTALREAQPTQPEEGIEAAMSGEAQAILFIHGIGGAGRAWAGQVASFAAAGFAPQAPDLPGFGGRPLLPAMPFESLAEDAEAFVARHHMRRPVLVGHSMGGMVAQTMLRRRPHGYAAAVLAATSPAFGNADGDFQRKFIADRLGPLDAGKTMAELAIALVDRMLGPQPDAAARALAIDIMGNVPPETYRAAVRSLTAFDERANLARIAIPVLCIAGEADPNAPPSVVERMARKIPRARYVCLPGVGHLANLEAPHAFDAVIHTFLRDIGATPP
jgi:3-oxoadipate enol-lactonase